MSDDFWEKIGSEKWWTTRPNSGKDYSPLEIAIGVVLLLVLAFFVNSMMTPNTAEVEAYKPMVKKTGELSDAKSLLRGLFLIGLVGGAIYVCYLWSNSSSDAHVQAVRTSESGVWVTLAITAACVFLMFWMVQAFIEKIGLPRSG